MSILLTYGKECELEIKLFILVYICIWFLQLFFKISGLSHHYHLKQPTCKHLQTWLISSICSLNQKQYMSTSLLIMVKIAGWYPVLETYGSCYIDQLAKITTEYHWSHNLYSVCKFPLYWCWSLSLCTYINIDQCVARKPTF